VWCASRRPRARLEVADDLCALVHFDNSDHINGGDGKDKTDGGPGWDRTTSGNESSSSLRGKVAARVTDWEDSFGRFGLACAPLGGATLAKGGASGSFASFEKPKYRSARRARTIVPRGGHWQLPERLRQTELRG